MAGRTPPSLRTPKSPLRRAPERPLLVAHRGNSAFAPENTRPALEQAIALGVDVVEVDIFVSREGTPVLIHYETLERTTNGRGRVDAYWVGELKLLDAGAWKSPRYAGEPIMTLAEALELARGRVPLNLDLKTPRAIQPTVKALQDLGMVDQVVVSGFDDHCVKAVRNQEPRLTVLLNHHPALTRLARNGQLARFRSDYISLAYAINASGLNADHHYVDGAMVAEAHRQGLSLWTYTVDEATRLAELVEFEVDSITTNWPERMLKTLGRGDAA